MDTQYIITGINRLTGLREQISVSYGSKGQAEKNYTALVATRASKRAYIYPKVQVYQRELFKSYTNL